MFSHRPTYSEIDLARLRLNYDLIRRSVPARSSIIPVVKADAYGHGSIECSLTLKNAGADMFAVSLPEEGRELRNAGISVPILTLGGFWPGQEQLLVEDDLTPAISDIAALKTIGSLDRPIDIHLKIDSGMGRAGFRWDETSSIVETLSRFPKIRVAGVLTHFASADDPAADALTTAQQDRFQLVVRKLIEAGIDPGILHVSNSPAALRRTDLAENAVRIGGGLYGLLDDIIPSEANALGLTPIMTVRSQVSLLKVLHSGESVGYNSTFAAVGEMLTAVVPIGYADGLPRKLSNNGHFIIRGQMAPIIGRISMDWTVVDVSGIDGVDQYDDVVVFGNGDDGSMTACEIASRCGTIGYEITCGISKRVPRVFING